MKLSSWLALAGLGLGAGVVLNSFLPRSLTTDTLLSEAAFVQPERSTLPDVDVFFLRSGSTLVPESLAVRGSFSFVPRVLSHSAVLISHPQATFLYDTGLCADIELFLLDQSFLFQRTLGNFVLEHPISHLLAQRAMKPADLDFILLSHLHWDHVSGIPDLPGVPLRINRVEYEVANQGLLDRNQGLVRRLMSNNPVDLFDFRGPPYAGFRSSYDLFDDGSIILVPLPGHTAGQVGMFINRAHGSRLFLIADAAWISDNYLRPATMHPLLWSMVTYDQDVARATLVDLHYFALQNPDIALIAMHDGHLQEAFTRVERAKRVTGVQ